MIDFDVISATVKENLCKTLSDDGTSKLAKVIIDASVDASIAVLKEYEKQKAND